LQNIQGFGKKTIEKIDEILRTGKLQKLENFKKDVALMTKLEMTRIWGVGIRRATELWNIGYRGVKDLRERGQDILTRVEKISVELFDELQERIPRSEVEEIGNFVIQHAQR
jgi:DNA polymerase/3'-5' exonuclease PolX